MLEMVEKTIHSSPDRAKYAMYNFISRCMKKRYLWQTLSELWTCSGAKLNAASLWQLMKSKKRYIKEGWVSSVKTSGVRF